MNNQNIKNRNFIRLFFIILITLITQILFTSNIPSAANDSKIVKLSKEQDSPEIEKYLTDRDYRLIQKNYKYYHWAAEGCNIPVESLIAIHYRESRLHRGYYSYKRKVVVKNLGGPFMLDCGGDGTDEFEANIRREERRIAKKYKFEGDTRVSHNFAFACLVAADYIKSKARYGLKTKKGIADMFWGYNGRVHKSYLDSSYVCSDPKNGNTMSFVYLGNTIVDSNPGCLAIFEELNNSKRFRKIVSKYN